MISRHVDHLKPFGLVVTTEPRGSDLRSIPTADLQQWVSTDRVVVLRNFAALTGSSFPEFCQQLGEILEWDFGAVNDLQVKAETQNYLYTNREVPFHWDGAFVGRVPHYIIFHCDLAPAEGGGGETLFADTGRLLERAPLEKLELWEQTSITYTTEKIVHYGGEFTSAMIGYDPLSGQQVLRFAEPVSDLNPVRLEIKGIPATEQPDFLKDLHVRLRDDDVCYRHHWLAGDVVIADNFVLLHGRNAFSENAARLIRRVNVL
jgi:alpha-ketoglutarate-dependent taurine dioxygenase